MSGVRYMHPRKRGPAGTVYHWKPSPSLRRQGWRNLRLGTDYKAAIAAAATRNLEVLSNDPLLITRRRIARIEAHIRRMDGILDALRERAAQQAVQGKVYFIAPMKGPIKIGWSRRPQRRLAQLQMNHPLQLRLLAEIDGAPELERAYHDRFAAHRKQGEWFEPHPEILDEIRRIKEATRNAPSQKRRRKSRRTSHGATASNSSESP